MKGLTEATLFVCTEAKLLNMRRSQIRTLFLVGVLLLISGSNSFAVTKVKPVPTPVLTPRSIFSDPQSCQLNSVVPQSPPFSLGYSRDPRWAPTHGTLNIAVVYLSYLDATINPKAMNEMVNIQEPNTQRFYASTSYGQLHINFLDAHKVYTIQKNLLTYNLKNDAPDMTTVFTDAMTAASADYDFTKVDELAIVLPDSLPVVDIGPNYGLQVTVGGATITRGFDLAYTNPQNHRVIDDGWLTHELGHTLGLTHPFLYNSPTSSNNWAYAWDVMQYDNTAAPNLFTWEKYILGWINDSQIDCMSTSSPVRVTAFLDSNGTADSAIKMLMYRLSDTQAIIVESRHKSETDPLTGAEQGVLVYKLDMNKGFGQGAITLVYKNAQVVNTKFGTEMYGSLHEGESVSSSGIKVTVLKSLSTGDFVRVSPAS